MHKRNRTDMKKQAYIGIKYYEDNRNMDEIQAISERLEDAGYKAICIARDVEKWGKVPLNPQELMERTFLEIDRSNIVVLEMSEKGVGLGIEAGYAYAKGIPIMVLIKEGQKLSNTMRGIADRVIIYRDMHQIDISAHNNVLQRTRTSRAAELYR